MSRKPQPASPQLTWADERQTFGRQPAFAPSAPPFEPVAAPFPDNTHLLHSSQGPRDDDPPEYSRDPSPAPLNYSQSVSPPLPPQPSRSVLQDSTPYQGRPLSPPSPQQQPLLSPQQHQHQPQQPQQPQQRSPGETPNYGATMNANPNDGYPTPQESIPPRRRPRRRKRRSLCSCACCCILLFMIIMLLWLVKKSINISDGTCLIPDNSDSRDIEEFVPVTTDLSLKLEVLDGIYGNVLVKESEAQEIHDVHINVQMRATSTQLLEQLDQRLSRFNGPYTNNAFSYVVHIHDRNDNDKKKRLLRRNCARVDIEIVYPRSSTGKLHVSVGNGELRVKMSPLKVGLGFSNRTAPVQPMPGSSTTTTSTTATGAVSLGALATFENVQLELVNGGINFENLVASKGLHAEVANGSIRGNVHTAGEIMAQTMNGLIELTVDTEPLRADWRPDDLLISAETLNGEIVINTVRRFLGHFRLSSTIGASSIRQSSNSHDILKYSRQRSKTLAGWISADGSEPIKATPRIDLETVNGAITLNVATSM